MYSTVNTNATYRTHYNITAAHLPVKDGRVLECCRQVLILATRPRALRALVTRPHREIIDKNLPSWLSRKEGPLSLRSS